MLLLNYELYDLYAVLIRIRCSPSDPADIRIVSAIIDLLDAPQTTNMVEVNAVRKAISIIEGIDKEKWHFAFVNNEYTFGERIIKDELSYKVLEAGFSELLDVLQTEDEKHIYDIADALHNVPIIFAQNCKNIKRTVRSCISDYRKKYNPNFLHDYI